MVETLLPAFISIFSVIAMVIGAIGCALGLCVWVAADVFGRPVKMNGAVGPIDWSMRRSMALLVTAFGCVGALGIWLYSNSWIAVSLAGVISLIPLWAIALFALILWLGITSWLSYSAGWYVLQRSFQKPDDNSLLSIRVDRAMMGNGVQCRNVLNISAHRGGVGLKQNRLFGFWTRPVIVPWEQVSVRLVEGPAPPLVRLTFGTLDGAAVTLPKQTWQKIETARQVA